MSAIIMLQLVLCRNDIAIFSLQYTEELSLFMQVVLQEQEKFNNSSRLEIIPFSSRLRFAASVNALDILLQK